MMAGEFVFNMANRRMISKSISTSRKLAKASAYSSLLFTWLIPHCDDSGNMDAEPAIVRGTVMPLRPESIEDTEKALLELELLGLVKMYQINEEKFLHINKWEDHQTLRTDRLDLRFPKPNFTNEAKKK